MNSNLTPVFLAPGRQGSTTELRPVIQNDGFRQTLLRIDSIQHPAHPSATQRGIDLDCRALARVIVHQRQHPNHPPPADAIADEVHRPPLIPSLRRWLGPGSTPADPPPLPNTHGQSFFAIQPVDTLMVRPYSFPRQHRRQPSIAETHASRNACAGRLTPSTASALPHPAPLSTIDTDASIAPSPSACGMPVSEQGRFVTSSPEQLNAWIGRESGKPVQVVTPQTDLTSELKRGIAFARRTKNNRRTPRR